MMVEDVANKKINKMENTKFHELCMVFGKAQQDFQKFETDCHLFSVELVKKFIEYLEIPQSLFSLYKINSDNKFEIVPPNLINALTPAEGSYWHFGMGLTVCSAPETLPQELILIHLFVRKDLENKFYAKLFPEPKEFEIDRNTTNGYQDFFDFLHKKIADSYEGEFQKFIGQSTSRKLGFKFNKEE